MPPLSALPPPCPLPCPSSFFSVSKGASQNLKPVPLGGRAHYSQGTGSQPASQPAALPPSLRTLGPQGVVLQPMPTWPSRGSSQVWQAGRAVPVTRGPLQRPQRPLFLVPSWPPLNFLSPTRTRQTHTHTHLVRPGTCPSPPVPELNDHITPRCLLRGSHAPSVAHRGLGAPAEPTMPRKSLLAAP